MSFNPFRITPEIRQLSAWRQLLYFTGLILMGLAVAAAIAEFTWNPPSTIIPLFSRAGFLIAWCPLFLAALTTETRAKKILFTIILILFIALLASSINLLLKEI